MTGVSTAAAAVLALILAWAGVAKLRRREATVDGFADLGLPRPGGLAVAVPVSELLVAAALLSRPRAGAVAAVVLLAAFTAFLVSRIRAGVPVGCGCFGSSRSRPTSAVEVVRNVGLVLLAAAAAGTVVPQRPALPELVSVLTAVAVATVGLGLLEVYVTTGRLLDNHIPAGPEERLDVDGANP